MIVFMITFLSFKTNALFYEVNYCCKDKEFTVMLKNSEDSLLNNRYVIRSKKDRYHKDFKISGQINDNDPVAKKIIDLRAKIFAQDGAISDRYMKIFDDLCTDAPSAEEAGEDENGDYYENRNLKLSYEADKAMETDSVIINIKNKQKYYSKTILNLILSLNNLLEF